MASIKSSGDTTLATINYKVTSSDLSFDNSYYFASSNTNSNFNVYYWSGSAWSSKYTQTKSGNFGHQIACTWDGDRFVVGSPHENKVYVYHSPGGSDSQKWTHNASGDVTSPTIHTISCPDSSTTGRRFGWSVSIAKDLGNHIIIGAPGDFTQSDSDGQKRGKVYIYEFDGSTWSKTFDKTDSGAHTDVSNAGSSVTISEPEIQLKESSATSGQAFYQVNNASPQFGFYVDISGYAEYIAIGVPGTPIGLLNSTNLDGYSGGDSIDRTGGNSDYFENTAQLGCIVCYTTSNTNKSWASNTSLYGKPVRGQTEMSWTSGLIGDNASNTVIWDFTALGTTCKLSLDGTRLIGGSPRYSFPGKQQSPNFGRLDAWNYSTTDSDWVLGKGRVVGNRPGNRLGMNIAIDYTGQRVAALFMKQPTEYSSGGGGGNSGIMIFDWNGNGFYEVIPEVQTNLGSNGDHTYGSVAISKGDVIAATAYNLTTNGTATFYFYKLTGGYDGNSLVGGYCAADAFLVGPNDGSTENTFKKQIKFGGTFFDNDYENTAIENRIYVFDANNTDGNQQGFSELIVSKKTGADAPDMIRLKANEFRIDTYINQTSTNTNQFYTSADGEYDHHPALTMNIAGNFKLNPEFLLLDTTLTSTTSSTANKFLAGIENTQCETKALLDVEGDIFGRRRINAGYLQGQKILGRKWPWQILYDTRSIHTIRGNNLHSNTFNEFNSSASYKHGRIYSKGVGSGTGDITHYESEGAITLPDSDFSILNNDSYVVKSIGSNGISGSFWFKLKNEHSTYPSAGATLISYGNPHATNHTGFRFQVTSTTIQFNFGSGIIKPTYDYSLTKDKWYHIYYAFKPNSITSWDTTTTDGLDNQSTQFYLWINRIQYSGNVLLTGSSLSNASGYAAKHYIGSDLDDSATNIYIGMVAHYNSHIHQQFHGTSDNYIGQFADVFEMYDWGPPEQKLAVGGDAYIQNRLGVNKFLPTCALDVAGTIRSSSNIVAESGEFSDEVLVSEYILAGGTTPESTSNAATYYFTVTVNASSKFVIDGTQQPTITLYRGVTYRFDQSDSSNGSHPFRISTTAEGSQYATGSSYNGSNGSSGAYRQFIVPANAPDTMYYNCSSHSGMGGTINTLPGTVTTNGVASSNVFVNNHMGIGIQTPKGPLHIHESTGSSHSAGYGTLVLEHGDSGGSSCIIFPSKKNYGSDYGYIQYEDSTSGTNELSRLIFGTENDGAGSTADNIILSPSTNVGIGTDTPTQAKLVVSGHGGSTIDIGTYGWLNSSGGTNQASGSNYYSIYANNRIAATEFNAYSDSRIKKNVVDINDSSALDKIRLLEPKIYNYIDEKQKGTSNVYGFIAQEVANVLPYAVTVSTGDIPNILTNSNVSVTSDSNVLELRLDTTVEGLTLSNTSNINITTDKNKYLTVPVLTFSGSNVITIQNSDTFSNVTGAYIHGEQVSNFNHLNKDAIWAVSTAALQEVDRQLQTEKTKVATLETQVADLLARVTALENA